MVALAGLLGLTSWAVASVSTWLVPVYVTAMVFIFVSPRAQPPEGSQDEAAPGQPTAAEGLAEGASRPSSPTPPRRSRRVDPPADGPPEAPAEGNGPSASGPAAAKPRRRSRARKPTRSGSEPAAAAAPATWIRVGPGKFVRAELHAQAADSEAPPQPDPPAEPSLAPTSGEGEGLLLEDSPEARVPIEEPAQADAPLEAGPIEPGPSPEFPAPSEEAATAPDPEPDPPPVMAQEPRADEASEELHPHEPPGSGEIDEDIPADPPDPEPVPEEYGIAPSAFEPDRPAASSEWDDREPDPAETTDPLDATAEDLAESEIGPNSPMAPEQAWAGDPGLTPAASGPLSAPIEAGSGPDPDGESPRGGVTGNGALRIRLAPRSARVRIPTPQAGPGTSRLVRNFRPGHTRGRRVSARPGSVVTLRSLASRRRNPGRPIRIPRGFQARSPPSRS
jgi:hypothetical protein